MSISSNNESCDLIDQYLLYQCGGTYFCNFALHANLLIVCNFTNNTLLLETTCSTGKNIFYN
jgi:hypothetical protein